MLHPISKLSLNKEDHGTYWFPPTIFSGIERTASPPTHPRFQFIGNWRETRYFVYFGVSQERCDFTLYLCHWLLPPVLQFVWEQFLVFFVFVFCCILQWILEARSDVCKWKALSFHTGLFCWNYVGIQMPYVF